MHITIMFGRKVEIAEVNLHQVIAKFEIGIMLMTDRLNDQFIQDIYDIGQLSGEGANVLVVTDDPSITMASLYHLQTNFPLIRQIFDAQSLIRPVRPFNMPERFVVEPGGRGSNKRPITLRASEECDMAQFRAWEWRQRWAETTRQILEAEKYDLSVGYQVRPLPRLGMPPLAIDDVKVKTDEESEFYDLIRTLSWPAITVPYHADDFETIPKLPGSFILDDKFERDDPLTTGLKTISDELRRQHAPMPMGAAANYTTARPTWDKATKEQILADLESVKKTLDSE